MFMSKRIFSLQKLGSDKHFGKKDFGIRISLSSKNFELKKDC